MKILVTPTSLSAAKRNAALIKLEERGAEIVFNPLGRPLKASELRPLLADCVGFIAGVDFVTEEALLDASRLKVISRYGSGVDRVALTAARERGIVVCNTPNANTNAAADLTFALILALTRRIVPLVNSTKAGHWERSTGMELAGKTLGILGLGSVGKAAARRARGFDMKIIAHTPHPDSSFAAEYGVEFVPFDALIERSDILSLHLPLTEKTRRLLSRSVLARMKHGAYLVNTARCGIVDESALYDMLRAGLLSGCGIDVYEDEPPSGSPLLTLPNVVATPHTGAHTAEAEAKMAEAAVQNLLDVLEGRGCPNIIA